MESLESRNSVLVVLIVERGNLSFKSILSPPIETNLWIKVIKLQRFFVMNQILIHTYVCNTVLIAIHSSLWYGIP